MSKQQSTWAEINKATAEKTAVCIEHRAAINALKKVTTTLSYDLEGARKDGEIANIKNRNLKEKNAEETTEYDDTLKITMLHKKMAPQLENEIKRKEHKYQTSFEQHISNMEFKKAHLAQLKETVLSLHTWYSKYKAALEIAEQFEADIKILNVNGESCEKQLAEIRERYRVNKNKKIVEFASNMLKLRKYYQLEKEKKQGSKEYAELTTKLMEFISSRKAENMEINPEDVARQFSPPAKEPAQQQVEQLSSTPQSIVEEIPQITETTIQYSAEEEKQVFAIPQSAMKLPPSQKVRVLQDVPVCGPKSFGESKRKMDDNDFFNNRKKHKNVQFLDVFQPMPSTSAGIGFPFHQKPKDDEKSSFFESNQFNFGNIDIPNFESDNDDNSDYGIGSKTPGRIEDFPPF